MASIDAFRDLAAIEPAPKPVMRMSLLRLGSVATSALDKPAARERALILVGVALVQVLFVLGLRDAMRQLSHHRSAASVPMQITFIERPLLKPIPNPLVARPPISHAQISLQPRSFPLPQRIAPRSDALQAVTIPPQVAPVDNAPPRAVLFDKDGALRVPEGPKADHPRDLLAHRNVSFMLPGAARKDSPDFHVTDPSPQDVVNSIGAGISKSMGIALAPTIDSNGVMPMAADRGLRTSDRDSDPCQDIAQNMMNADNANEREDAEHRYEASCQ